MHTTNFPNVTGGVYEIWELIHRTVLIYDYSRLQLHDPVAKTNSNTVGFKDLLELTFLPQFVPTFAPRV